MLKQKERDSKIEARKKERERQQETWNKEKAARTVAFERKTATDRANMSNNDKQIDALAREIDNANNAWAVKLEGMQAKHHAESKKQEAAWQKEEAAKEQKHSKKKTKSSSDIKTESM